MELKPGSLSRALQLYGHRGSLTPSSASTEETISISPSHILASGCICSVSVQAHPWSAPFSDERLRAWLAMGSPLATNQANHCLLLTHQPDPTTSMTELANCHEETPGAAAPDKFLLGWHQVK